ncbi:MAG: hypothetical protein ACREDT_08995 [Methylocella sp.]
MVPAIDIFIRTYFRDFRWLELSLLSILKFVKGFRRIIIVMPASSVERLRGGEIPASARVTVVPCQEFTDDYIGQQVTKLSADLFTDAPLIAHIDSDCIFHVPCSLPALLTKNGRPIIRILRRSRRPASAGWRRCVADFHSEPLPFDALVTPPIIYPSSLYGDLRGQCRDGHGIGLDQWILSRRIEAMSEFGLMAGQAWFKRRDDFFWVSADDEESWPCWQYWSRSPKAPGIQAELSRVLGRRS